MAWLGSWWDAANGSTNVFDKLRKKKVVLVVEQLLWDTTNLMGRFKTWTEDCGNTESISTELKRILKQVHCFDFTVSGT